MMKKTLPLMLVIVIAVSGCLGGGDIENVEEGVELTVSPISGPAPLNVTFTLDHAEADVDWTFGLGDGTTLEGSGLPETVEHVYRDPGNHTAVLEIEGTSLNASLTIRVTGTAMALQEYTGGWQASSPVYCAIAGPVLQDLSGLMTDSTSIPLETIGETFQAEFSSDVEEGVVGYDVHFADTDDGFVVLESHSGAPGEQITGTVPEGADEVHFSACGVSGAVEVTYQAG